MNGVATRVTVVDSSQVAEARRVGASMASQLGFNETETGTVAIAITEGATNLIKHAAGGEILFRSLEPPEASGLEMLVLDKGPGMANFSQCLRDGYSTAGSLGTGLGAITRLAGWTEAYSQPGGGTALAARFWPGRPPANHQRLQISGLSVAVREEPVCGDAWAVLPTQAGLIILVVDGLGHGPFAHEAALASVEAFRACTEHAPAEVMSCLHQAIRSTRGASAAVVSIDVEAQTLCMAGIGNIAGIVISGDRGHHLVSMNGTLGHQIRDVREFTYPWIGSPTLILHSDGLSSRWNLAAYPGLAQRSPSLIAGVLYRDMARPRDDATVVVLCQGRGE